MKSQGRSINPPFIENRSKAGELIDSKAPWFDKLTMRAEPLKTRDLILSLSKDEAKIPCFFSSLLVSDVPGPFVGVYAKRPELPVQRRALHAHEFRGA
jgi:hypothetical protein